MFGENKRYQGRWKPQSSHQTLNKISGARHRNNPAPGAIREQCVGCPRLNEAANKCIGRIASAQWHHGYALGAFDAATGIAKQQAVSAKMELGEEVMVIARDSLECSGVTKAGECGFVPYIEREQLPAQEAPQLES